MGEKTVCCRGIGVLGGGGGPDGKVLVFRQVCGSRYMVCVERFSNMQSH